MKCNGCVLTPAVSSMMQCPLCQAEGSTTEGFYCSQDCFGKSWLAHRDSAHKKGVVRQKASVAAVAEEDEKKASKRTRAEAKAAATDAASPVGRTKRSRAETKAASKKDAEKPKMPLLLGSFWRPLPSTASCVANGSCQLSPTGGAAAASPSSKKNAPKKGSVHSKSAGVTFDTLPGRTDVTLCNMDDTADVTAANTSIVPSVQMWSACQAVASICHDVLAAEKADSARNIVVVCGSALSAFAVAWAMRSAAASGKGAVLSHLAAPEMALSTTHSDLSVAPEDKKLKSRIRIVRTAVLRAAQYSLGKRGANLSEWVDGNLVVTLPDVVAPEQFQSMLCRAIFIRTGAASDDDASVVQTLSLLPTEDVPAIESHFPRETGAGLDAATPSAEELADESEAATVSLFASGAYFISGRFDDLLATALVRGDLEGVISRVVQLYDMHSRPKFEEMVSNALLCDRGALHVWQQSHKLAFLLRRWATIAERGCANITEARTLMGCIGKAVTRAAESMPTPLHSRTDRKALNAFATKAAAKVLAHVAPSQPSQLYKDPTDTAAFINTPKTNMMIGLQATLVYLLNGAVPEIYVDRLAMMWGISELALGWTEFAALNQHRAEYVTRLVSRYSLVLADLDADFGTKGIKTSRAPGGQVSRPIAGGTSVATNMPVGEMQYVVIMYHLCVNHAARFATMTVKDLDFVLQWSHSSLQHFLGSLHQFVLTSGLAEGTLMGVKGGKHEKVQAATGKPAQFTAANITDATYLKPVAHMQAIKMVVVPVSERDNIQKDRMSSAALDELLSAIPKVPVPMYIGDVGQLIGIWSKFNARYGGHLGYKLSDFLAKFPEEFTVVDNIVTRIKEGKTEQIRVRFDNEISSDDEGDDDTVGTGGNKKRQSRITEGEGKKLHRKARRKAEKKARNKTRFDKNHKHFDPAAKVPGYVKHGERKIKGRGKKANIRVWKRQL